MDIRDILPEVDLTPRMFDPKAVRLRDPKQHFKEDFKLFREGVLDLGSLVSGYIPQRNPVEVVVRDKYGKLKAIRRQHNLRTTQGRDNWQRLVMAGDITANATGYTKVAGTASSAPTATTLTNSSAAFPTSGGVNGSLQGHVVYVPGTGNGVYGIIMSNTATVLTVDQWYDATSATGAAGTTPASAAPYIISPNAGAALWMGLSTNSAAAAAGDVLRTSDGLFGDGTSGGASTEQTANGLARAYVQPTFASGQYQLQKTFTYSTTGSVTIAKVVLCNSLAAAGSLLFLETLLSATFTVAASGDNAQITWTVTL